MRGARLLALAVVAAMAPLSRSAAQTCVGNAAFQDGRMRVTAFYQGNRDVFDAGTQFSFGIPRSFYATGTLDGRGDYPPPRIPGDPDPGFAGNSELLGGGIELGYQIHLSDTPFQFCPALSVHIASNVNSSEVHEFGFGGSLGYRVPVSNWLTLVPSAGLRWVTTTECCEASPSYNEVRMAMGLVVSKLLAIQPGLVVPSRDGSKTSYTIAVSINWWR